MYLAYWCEYDTRPAVYAAEIEKQEDTYAIVKERGVWQNECIFDTQGDAYSYLIQKMYRQVGLTEVRKLRLAAHLERLIELGANC